MRYCARRERLREVYAGLDADADADTEYLRRSQQ